MADLTAPSALRSDQRRPSAPVRLWLLAVAALVIAMVAVGGATRLTGSGLSITEWKPIMGAVPPLTDADWQDAFHKYKQIPQYHQINKGMSLEAFKTIFWWEWGHRFLARLVGVVFLVPFLALLALGYIRRALVPRLVGLFALGGLQGAIGWYMVASGLSERVSVSQYRLALHLGLAFVILGGLIWTALSLDDEEKPVRRALPAGAVAVLALSFLQVELGALVAGMKAGLAYNTWPLMDGQLVPRGLLVMEPWYLNLFENAMTVQFNHRMVAYLLAAVTAWHVAAVLRTAAGPQARASALALGLATLVQIGLGIWTLLAQVPLGLGLVHQLGAAILFSITVWHAHALKAAR
ncbi:MAG: COX15/CtaA family protein [Hyphomicrobiaceae bacterium]|nr:COX15/CtaA family protein [Hyphomicrobiaceae bacterium]